MTCYYESGREKSQNLNNLRGAGKKKMTIQDFIKDCQEEGLTKLETYEVLTSWLEEFAPEYLDEVVDLVEKYY